MCQREKCSCEFKGCAAILISHGQRDERLEKVGVRVVRCVRANGAVKYAAKRDVAVRQNRRHDDAAVLLTRSIALQGGH